MKIRRLERRPGIVEPDHAFFCPACQSAHGITTREPGEWTFNGDFDRPTITPSVKVTGYRLSAEGEAMIERGESIPVGQKYPGANFCCHSEIADGMIKFAGDCTHGLVGQTVPLPDFGENSP